MKRIGKIIGWIVLVFFAVMGLIFTALIIYYYPVIDRLYIRPCYYYPNMFIDCKE